MLAAGKYTVYSKLTAGTATQTLKTYVTLSGKRIYTYTKVLKKDVAHKSAGGLSKGWLGWSFSLPSATVYKKLTFAIYGKTTGTPRGVFGPHNYAMCPGTAWDWQCTSPYTTFPTATSWKSVTGSVTKNRSGRTVRVYAIAGANGGGVRARHRHLWRPEVVTPA